MTGILLRVGSYRNIDVEGRQLFEDRNWSDGATSQGRPASTRSWGTTGRLFPRNFRESMMLLTPWFWTVGPRSGRINFCIFKSSKLHWGHTSLFVFSPKKIWLGHNLFCFVLFWVREEVHNFFVYLV